MAVRLVRVTEYMIDESFGRADPHALPPEVTTVAGYLSFDASKNLTRANIDGYHAAGRSILLNWEASSGGALNAQNGEPHAKTAIKEAQDLGAPAGVAIVFSDDTDSHTSQVLPYYRMVAQATRRAGFLVGAYGGADVVQELLRMGVIDVAWVAAASSWSHGTAVTTAHIRQLVDHPIHIVGFADSAYDVNEVVHPIPGLWTPTGATTGDEDMGYSQWQPLEKIALMDDVRKAVIELMLDLPFLSNDPRVGGPGPGIFSDLHNLARPGALQTISAQIVATLAAVKQSQTPGQPVDAAALQQAIANVPHEVLVALHEATPSS